MSAQGRESKTNAGPTPFLTVEEAAKRLRIGRTLAYQLARRYRDTNGVEGLPVVAFGSLLRVPRAKLEALAGGPINEPEPAPVIPIEPRRETRTDAQSDETLRPHANRTRTRRAFPDAQTSLPFTAPDAS